MLQPTAAQRRSHRAMIRTAQAGLQLGGSPPPRPPKNVGKGCLRVDAATAAITNPWGALNPARLPCTLHLDPGAFPMCPSCTTRAPRLHLPDLQLPNKQSTMEPPALKLACLTHHLGQVYDCIPNPMHSGYPLLMQGVLSREAGVW